MASFADDGACRTILQGEFVVTNTARHIYERGNNMAYFSNGTEGMDYESRYCDNCRHMYGENGDPYACSVLELHYEFNYAQCGKGKTAKAIAKVLNTLIPRDDRGFAKQCTLFTDKNEVTDEEAKYLEELRFGKAA